MFNARKDIVITDELVEYLGDLFINSKISKNSNMTFEQFVHCWKNNTLDKIRSF